MTTLADKSHTTVTSPTHSDEGADLSILKSTIFVVDTVGQGALYADNSTDSTSAFAAHRVALLELGGIPIFCHALLQLESAAEIAVLCTGSNKSTTKGIVAADGGTTSTTSGENEKQLTRPILENAIKRSASSISNDLTNKLQYIEIDTEKYDAETSFVSTFEALKPYLEKNYNIVMIPLNCIFSSSILYSCALRAEEIRSEQIEARTRNSTNDSSGSAISSMAIVLEVDLEGMVGLPQSWIKASFDPLAKADIQKRKVVEVSHSLRSYGAIFTGLYAITPGLMESTAMKVLVDPKLRKHFFSLTTQTTTSGLESVLSMLASENALDRVSTRGNTWVSIVSAFSYKHAKSTLVKVGHSVQSADGKALTLFGMPQSLHQRSSHTGGDWSSFNVNKWRSAVFTTKAYFSELYEDTNAFVLSEIEDVKWHCQDQKPLLIEVGCGTGEALLPLTKYCGERIGFCIGVDINPKFIQFCQQQVNQVEGQHTLGDDIINDKGGSLISGTKDSSSTSSKNRRVQFVNEDACELSSVIERLFDQGKIPLEYKTSPRVVMCVGNTVGIMPKGVKDKVLEEMVKVAGTEGCAIVVYWNGNCFGDGVQNFYHKNFQLCGKFSGKHVDFDNCVLETETGYRTHWSKPEEVQEDLRRRGFRVKRVLEKGKGVMASFR